MSLFFDENILADKLQRATCAHLFHISSSAFDARQQREGIFWLWIQASISNPPSSKLKIKYAVAHLYFWWTPQSVRPFINALLYFYFLSIIQIGPEFLILTSSYLSGINIIPKRKTNFYEMNSKKTVFPFPE
jgi:hypothetical protein